MTDYTDVPTANALHAESQQIVSAIANLDAGGTISNMTIAPPPYVPPEPGTPMGPMLMAVNVMVPPPVDPALTAQLRTWMDTRLATISTQLTDLGVVVPPTSAGMAVGASRGAPPPQQYPPMSVMQPAGPPPVTPPPPITPRAPEPPKE